MARVIDSSKTNAFGDVASKLRLPKCHSLVYREKINKKETKLKEKKIQAARHKICDINAINLCICMIIAKKFLWAIIFLKESIIKKNSCLLVK